MNSINVGNYISFIFELFLSNIAFKLKFFVIHCTLHWTIVCMLKCYVVQGGVFESSTYVRNYHHNSCIFPSTREYFYIFQFQTSFHKCYKPIFKSLHLQLFLFHKDTICIEHGLYGDFYSELQFYFDRDKC